jgi:hypothetical protein
MRALLCCVQAQAVGHAQAQVQAEAQAHHLVAQAHDHAQAYAEATAQVDHLNQLSSTGDPSFSSCGYPGKLSFPLSLYINRGLCTSTEALATVAVVVVLRLAPYLHSVLATPSKLFSCGGMSHFDASPSVQQNLSCPFLTGTCQGAMFWFDEVGAPLTPGTWTRS